MVGKNCARPEGASWLSPALSPLEDDVEQHLTFSCIHEHVS